jgi:hypothetical protein
LYTADSIIGESLGRERKAVGQSGKQLQGVGQHSRHWYSPIDSVAGRPRPLFALYSSGGGMEDGNYDRKSGSELRFAKKKKTGSAAVGNDKR